MSEKTTRKTVIVRMAEGVRIVSLNRPERLNAINSELLADLRAALWRNFMPSCAKNVCKFC